MATIKRAKRDTPFVIIDKTALQDNRLSWKAKGLLAYLLSLPDDWKVYVKELSKHATDGRDATNTAIKELIKVGYITRERVRGEDGQFTGWDYTVTENGFSVNGKPENGKSNTTNNNLTNKDLISIVGQDPTSPIPFSEIINYLNEKIGTNYKASTKATKTKINARWQEGFKLDDFKRVIDCKAAAWQYDTKMNQYLRPETLFGTKFESYLNACKSQPDVNLVQDLIDIELQEAQTHDYLNYHQTIRDKFPRLYANVRMLKASDYFDLKPGAKRYELLNYRFTVSEIKKNIAKAHQDIEKGLTQGRSYVDVLTELNGLLRQTV
jgi:uncharacterized phage protein (TIGR02220 family)